MPPDDEPPIRSPAPARSNSRRRRTPPRVLRRLDAARFYRVAPATLDRLNAAGAIPAPVTLGRTLVWNRAELQAHLDHGGPPRREWAALWAEIVRHRRTRG